MLKNLLKSWAELAPDEIIFPFGGQKFYLKNLKGNDYDFHVERLDETEFWTLQGYIQRCIEARGWYFSLQQTHDYCKADVRASIEKTPYQIGKYTNDCHEVLLTAYLTALAAQRSVQTGLWRHFKPETPVAEVTCVAGWGGIESDPYPWMSHLGYFALEEDPNVKVRLAEVITGVETGYFIYFADQDYGDRVFYHYGGDRFWARLYDNFLGLVGSNHPEHEGLLRFVEVSDASPQ